MKIRDRENRKILTGFRDMADFVTGNRDPIPPPGGPLGCRAQKSKQAIVKNPRSSYTLLPNIPHLDLDRMQ